MLRSVFEVVYLCTIIFLVNHYVKLFRNVVKLRRETKTSLGYKNKNLERAIRAHANFCETVPICLLLTFILYFNNLLFFAIPSILILAIGRRIHSNAISDIKEDVTLRVKGMKLTIWSIKIAVLGIIFYVVQILYYLLKIYF